MPEKCEIPSCNNSAHDFVLNGRPHSQCMVHWHDTMADLVHGRQLEIVKALQGRAIPDNQPAQLLAHNAEELRHYFRSIGVET